MITKGVNLKLDIEPLKMGNVVQFYQKMIFFSHCSSRIIRKDLDFELNAMHLFLVKFNTSIVEFVLCGYKKVSFFAKSHLVERFLFSIAFLSRQSFTKRSIGLGLLSGQFSKPQRGHLWQKLKCLENISTTSHT